MEETRPKDPLEVLKTEHQTALTILDALEGALKCCCEQGVSALETCSCVLKEARNFLERDLVLHFRKERDALFPALTQHLPEGTGPMVVMLADYENLGDEYTQAMKCLRELEAPSAPIFEPVAAEVSARAGSFIHTLRDLIAKEEKLLLVMADGFLTKEERTLVGEKMSAIDMWPERRRKAR